MHALPSRARVSVGPPTVFTADLDRFRRFYEDVLGLRTLLLDDTDGRPFRRLAMLTDGDGRAVRLIALEVPGYRSDLPDDVIGRRGRVDHLAFDADADAFAPTIRRLVEVGASAGSVIADGAFLEVLFVDPDGGHHHLRTPRTDWAPGRSTELLDPGAWHRILRHAAHPGANATPPDQPQGEPR